MKMDYVTAFEKLRTEILKADTKKLKGDFAIQVTMTDDDCHGIFYISFMSGVLEVQPFDYVDNTAAIALTKLSLMNLISGKSKVEKLVENGKMKITGDESVVKMLFAAMPEKKPAVKKVKKEQVKESVTAKKAEKKKSGK